MVGAIDRRIHDLAARDGTLAAHVPGKTADGRGTGHRGPGDRHIRAGGHAGIIVLRRAQETSDHTRFGGSGDSGFGEGDIGNGSVQHTGKAGIGNTAAGEALDGMAAAVQVDALVKRSCAVKGRPIANAGGIDIIDQDKILDRPAFQHAGVVHIVQLASIRDEIGILRGAVAAHEILQGQVHAGE